MGGSMFCQRAEGQIVEYTMYVISSLHDGGSALFIYLAGV